MLAMWFVLVVSSFDNIPRMAGPYPTRAVCVQSARVMDPYNFRFWDKKEIDRFMKDTGGSWSYSTGPGPSVKVLGDCQQMPSRKVKR